MKPAVSPPYVEPFKVISRNKENHTFVINVDKSQKTVFYRAFESGILCAN